MRCHRPILAIPMLVLLLCAPARAGLYDAAITDVRVLVEGEASPRGGVRVDRPVTLGVRVQNRGSAATDVLRVRVTAEEAGAGRGALDVQEVELGSLAAGAERTVRVNVALAQASGDVPVRLTAQLLLLPGILWQGSNQMGAPVSSELRVVAPERGRGRPARVPGASWTEPGPCDVSIAAVAPASVAAGQPFTVHLRVQNRGARSSPVLRLRTSVDLAAGRGRSSSLAAREQTIGSLSPGLDRTFDVRLAAAAPPAGARGSATVRAELLLLPELSCEGRNSIGRPAAAPVLVLAGETPAPVARSPHPAAPRPDGASRRQLMLTEVLRSPDRRLVFSTQPLPAATRPSLHAPPDFTLDLQVAPSLKYVEGYGEHVKLVDQAFMTSPKERMSFYWTWPGPVAPAGEMRLIVYEDVPQGRNPLVFQTSQPMGNAGSKGAFYDLDFSGFLGKSPPPKAKQYWVEVQPLDGAVAGPPSKALPLLYGQDESVTDFSSLPVGYKYQTEGTLKLELDDLWVGNPDDGGGDEPYLIVAVVVLDGNTIDLGRPEQATARVFFSQGTHGNLGALDDVGQGTKVAIPAAVGTFTIPLKPIPLPNDVFAMVSLLPMEQRAKVLQQLDAFQMAFVATVVIAMDEDSTPTDVVEATRKVMVDNLGPKLNQALQSKLPEIVGTLKSKAITEKKISQQQATKLVMDTLLPEIDRLSADLQEMAKDAAISTMLMEHCADFTALLMGFPAPSVLDPDDQVGSAFSYHVINMGKPQFDTAIYDSIYMWLGHDSASYSVKGRLRLSTWVKEIPIYDAK